MTKTNTATKWVLKSKVTGKIYPTFAYATRSAARKAANGRRFKGEYMPVKFVTKQTAHVPTKTTFAAMQEAAPIVYTETKTVTKRTVNRNPILRSQTGSTSFNSFPIHQRWM